MNINQQLVDKLINALESNTAPWIRDWKTLAPHNPITGTIYKGINALVLSVDGRDHRYVTPKSAIKAGIDIKGSKTVPIVFWKKIIKKDSEGNEKEIPILLYYRVIPLSECSNVPKKFEEVLNDNEEHLDGEEVVNRLNVNVQPGEPSYTPCEDIVRMPPIGHFDSSGAYYHAMFHEIAHWTGPRLKRKKLSYAAEELVADVTAWIVVSRLGIEYSLTNVAAYCKGWAGRLKETPAKEIVKACSEAFKAVEYILSKENVAATP